jgi:hypothetical protein
VSAAVTAAFRDAGIVVREDFGTIDAFEKTQGGVRMIYARVPFSFPTYAGILGRAAASAARQLNLEVRWQTPQIENLQFQVPDR